MQIRNVAQNITTFFNYFDNLLILIIINNKMLRNIFLFLKNILTIYLQFNCFAFLKIHIHIFQHVAKPKKGLRFVYHTPIQE